LRAASIVEEYLGKTHPDLAEILKNLGLIHKKRGEYSEAEELYSRALEIVEVQASL
jgi:tetratricopeptide (TPR) repeat protein